MKAIVIRPQTGRFEAQAACRDRSGVWSRLCGRS
nr:MAG TPA: adaptor-to-host cellular mRNA binding domain protein [Caudoviricetes sp.]